MMYSREMAFLLYCKQTISGAGINTLHYTHTTHTHMHTRTHTHTHTHAHTYNTQHTHTHAHTHTHTHTNTHMYIQKSCQCMYQKLELSVLAENIYHMSSKNLAGFLLIIHEPCQNK